MKSESCNIAKQGKNCMPQCALKITHIGEALLAAILNDNSGLMKTIAGTEKSYTAEPEVIFTNKDKQKFDGEHKIDVLLIPLTGEAKAIPVELKLGNAKMAATKSGFGRFLTGYQYNKPPERFTGSMVSILSRRKGCNEEITYPLLYHREGIEKFIKISEEWKLIVLTESIKRKLDQNGDLWEGSIKPQIFSIEELFRDKMDFFNDKVREIIQCDNYYETWLPEKSDDSEVR